MQALSQRGPLQPPASDVGQLAYEMKTLVDLVSQLASYVDRVVVFGVLI